MKLYLPMTIPISSVYGGMLIYDHPNITIEYKKWSWSKSKYEILSSTIKINDIESIKILDRGIFETRIDFQFKSLKLIENIPNISGLVIFQFKLKNKKKAINFGMELQEKLTDIKNKEIDDEIKKIEK